MPFSGMLFFSVIQVKKQQAQKKLAVYFASNIYFRYGFRIDNRIPMNIILDSNELPPYDNKGSEIPLTGMTPIVIPMFWKICRVYIAIAPEQIYKPKGDSA